MANHKDGPEGMDALLTVDELMGLLKVKRSTVYSWVGRSAIPYVKLESTGDTSRGLLRFLRSDVLAWLSKRKRGGHDENS